MNDCTFFRLQDIEGKLHIMVPTRDYPPKCRCRRFTSMLITVDYRYRHIPAASVSNNLLGSTIIRLL